MTIVHSSKKTTTENGKKTKKKIPKIRFWHQELACQYGKAYPVGKVARFPRLMKML